MHKPSIGLIPRIQGKVAQAAEPEEVKGKWFFEMWITSIGGGEVKSLGVVGPWESEEVAKRELENAAKLACQHLEKEMTGKVSGEFLDMKTNQVRKWDKSDEH